MFYGLFQSVLLRVNRYLRVYTFSDVNSKESAVIIFSAESFSSV